jgi:hypothetical protein
MPTTRAWMMVVAVLVSACAGPTAYRTGPDALEHFNAIVRAMSWTTSADYDYASGMATCSVEHQAYANSTVMVTTVVGAAGRHGVLQVAAAQSVYPGSTLYAAVGDRRFSGVERIELTPELLSALRGGVGRLYLSWTIWPQGTGREAAVDLEGFGEAYDKCDDELARVVREGQP